MSRTVGWSLKRTGRLMLIYVALLVGLSWAFVRLPGGFLPVDDQGFITTDVQTPSDSSYARTEAAVEKVEKYLLARDGVENVTFLTGFSFLGQGINTAQAFITLKDWSERGPKEFGRRDRRRHQSRPVVASATPGSPRCSRRRSTTSAIPRVSASACRIAAKKAIRRCCRRPTS